MDRLELMELPELVEHHVLHGMHVQMEVVEVVILRLELEEEAAVVHLDKLALVVMAAAA